MAWSAKAACACAALLLAAALVEAENSTGKDVDLGRPPRLVPDYAGVTVPPNIAPLNFRIAESGTEHRVRFVGASNECFSVEAEEGEVQIDADAWRTMLAAGAGGRLEVQISARRGGSRVRFEPTFIDVAAEPIDPYVVYRLMNPIYRVVAHIDIRQRSLESFDERTLVGTQSFDGCVNCHTFAQNDPGSMVLHMRSSAGKPLGAGMLLVEPDGIRKVSTSTQRLPGLAAFTSWHPNGQMVAFSVNRVAQFFHSSRNEVRDVYDLKSDLACYDFTKGAVTSTGAITRADRLETFPCWAPDGRHLYYSSAPVLWEGEGDDVSIDRYSEVRYSLERIAYDAAVGTWGEPEVVLDAEQWDSSITQPRISPDGRFVVTCMSDYSTFPSFQPSADLYLTDLQTGETRRMECNSDQSESWHSWSSNGRWLAFSSKRADGQFIRVYIAHVDEEGRARKAFVLPQESPTFYDSFIRLHQLPELVAGPVPAGGDRIAAAIRKAEWERVKDPVTGATPAVSPQPDRMPEPWSSAHQ